MRDYRRNRARAARCMNCREKGHRTFDCPLPPNPSRCYMCGNTGHSEPRCPNTLCFWVNQKQEISTQPLIFCNSIFLLIFSAAKKQIHLPMAVTNVKKCLGSCAMCATKGAIVRHVALINGDAIIQR